MARVYHFDLPYTMSASNVFYGVKLLKGEGAFARLPKDIQVKMEKANANWHPLKVHKEDLDRIDDQTWTSIASKLNLKWEDVA